MLSAVKHRKRLHKLLINMENTLRSSSWGIIMYYNLRFIFLSILTDAFINNWSTLSNMAILSHTKPSKKMCIQRTNIKADFCSYLIKLNPVWIKLNPFVPNAPFLCPLKTSENRNVFWCFQGVEKECIGKERVKMSMMGDWTISWINRWNSSHQTFKKGYSFRPQPQYCEGTWIY